MLPTRRGSFRLFRFAGIDVFLHWSWFVVGAIAIGGRTRLYSSLTGSMTEQVTLFLALFLIVLLHEFGHALACRQVGGRANQIVLWPLGGVAYVDPPPRPGATLWSIAAGPLVNVALVPVLFLLGKVGRSLNWDGAMPNADALFQAVWSINLGLLIFNLLPIYPLDGGQILRSLLWFVLGRAYSLMAAAVIGIAGVAGLFGIALLLRSPWLAILSAFILMNCWRGLMLARALSRAARAPRRDGFACPNCQTAPPMGAFWVCLRCRTPFDTFETHSVCPRCAAQFPVTGCLECGALRPMSEWLIPPPVPRGF